MRQRRATAIRIAMVTTLVVGSVGAQPKAPVVAPPRAQPEATARASGVVYLAREIATGIGTVPNGALVVVSPLASDTPAPKGEELASRLAVQIAGRLGSARAHPTPTALAAARGLSGRAASLVYVQLEIAKGELRATADLYPVVSNGWDRLRNPAPGPRAHAFATTPLDAEIRSFLTPVMLEQATVRIVKHDEGEVIALGCGDVEGDGGMELVLMSRARVSLNKIKAGKLVPIKTASWNNLAVRSPVPMREPLGAVVVSPRRHPGEIFLGMTDRTGVVVDGALAPRRPLTGIPVPGADGDACAQPVAEASAFDGYALGCTVPVKGEPQVALQTPSPRFDGIASLDLVGKDGSSSQVVASREPGGKLRLRRTDGGAGKPIELTVEGIGAQVALADLDLDGVAEVITTSEAGVDAIVVSSLKNTLVPRLRLPAKEGVRALAVCPPEERGVPALAAVVGSEVWIVR